MYDALSAATTHRNAVAVFGASALNGTLRGVIKSREIWMGDMQAPQQRRRCQGMRTTLFTMLGLGLGAFPGLSLFALFELRAGLAIAILGAVLGGAFGLYRISPTRVGRLFVAMLVAKNIPFAGKAAMDWVDGGDTEPVEDSILVWVLSAEKFRLRKGAVALGMLAGLIGGYFLVSHDLACIAEQRTGIVLPLEKARDSMTTQAGLVYFACVVWGGTLVALAATWYRRPLILVLLFSLLIGGSLSFAANMSFKASLTMVILMATVFSAAALLLLFLSKEVAWQELKKERHECHKFNE